jgi:metal-responsive CopG/Arc/MetJ family transcriptional regulator
MPLNERTVLLVGISKELHDEFKQLIKKTKGSNRENLMESVEEAIRDWIKKKSENS